MKTEKIIFDIGMHKGQDTEFYLKNGFNVVAVEANPILATQNRNRFSQFIKDKRLIILNKGIADKEGHLKFYINNRLSEWSSFDPELGKRGNSYSEIEVSCTKIDTLFEKYGIPYYIKIDIEGYDIFCLNGIPGSGEGPQYVSTEISDESPVSILYEKGYRKFKLINQFDNFNPISFEKETSRIYQKLLIVKNGIKLRTQNFFPYRFKYGSSGPFGEESKGKWINCDTVLFEYRRFNIEREKCGANMSWLDIHATF